MTCFSTGVLPYVPWLAGGWLPRLQAFQPWTLLAVAVIVLFTLMRRRWLVASLTVVLLVMGMAPNVVWPSDQATLEGASADVTVFSFNALKAGADAKQLATSIQQVDPDVVVLVETSEALHDRLRAEGALGSLKYRSAPVPTGGERDTVIFSRYPLKDLGGSLGPGVTGWYGMPVVEVELPGRTLTVVGVHVYPPLGSAKRWAQGLSALQHWIGEEGNKPLILAGDFNSARSHPQFRKLASIMDDESTLFPLSTWPANRNVPPLLGIDHVLSRGFIPLEQEILQIHGSDHLAIKATFGLIGR